MRPRYSADDWSAGVPAIKCVSCRVTTSALHAIEQLRGGELPADERPQEHRLIGGVEACNQAGRRAGMRADMPVPQAGPVIALVRRGNGAEGNQLAPGGFAGGEVVEYFDPRD